MTRRNFLVTGVAGITTTLTGSVLATARAPRELRLGLSSPATSADPHYQAVSANVSLSQHIFDALVHVDAAGRYVPGLATSWRATDAYTWEIKLRPGVRFHDGSLLTMEDVLHSLRRPGTIIDSPGPFTTFSKQFVRLQPLDDSTLEIKTREPYGGLPGDLSSLFIVSKKASERAQPADFDAGRAAVGTGPFKLRRFTKGESVRLERHDAYWGGRPDWEAVTLTYLTDDKQRTAALLSDEVDAIEAVPSADTAKLREQRGLSLIQRTSWRTIFFHLEQFTDRSPWIFDANGQPMTTSPLKDRRVRRALSLAIDREAVVKGIMGGQALPAAQLVAPGIVGYNETLKPDPYDPAQARKLLADAGFPNGFSLTLHAPNNRYINDEKIAGAVAHFWGGVGVRTKIETFPAADYFARARRGEFSVAMLGYGSMGADFALRALLGTPDSNKGWGTWNWAKYTNSRLDATIHAALQSTDPSKRQLLAAAAMDMAMHDHAVLPLHHQLATWCMRKGISYAGRVDEFTFAHHFKIA